MDLEVNHGEIDVNVQDRQFGRFGCLDAGPRPDLVTVGDGGTGNRVLVDFQLITNS